ncbi:putative bifunctional diguanylate cyclase/phosphodiesterase [Caballeronia sp.]|uniref:putative bifunctional diguanylate cyclase/phosphodiesterase n=1 Tax=Caballeronia sp. TaxID=1931223 RepID=UPI003C5F1F1E
MRLHSLRARIAVVFVLLMLVVQVAAFVVIHTAISSNARNNADDQLSVAERVFNQVMRSDREELRQASTIVAADYGFRAAVGTRDEATVSSALKNHGDRVHADVVMLATLDGVLLADSHGPAKVGTPFPWPALLVGATRDGDAASIGVMDGHLYQLVAVPVKAPLPVAWVTMGFLVDDALATEMRSITSLDVSFVDKLNGASGTAAPRILASSLPLASRRALQAGLDMPETKHAGPHASTISLPDGDYAMREFTLPSSGDATVTVVLQRSLNEAMAPYSKLQSTLLLITLLGVAVSAVGSFLTARSVTRPIEALTRFARRIGRGERTDALEVRRHDEISELAVAFNQMRDGIAERERRITDLAYLDRLTGLPNRALFSERLQQAISEALRLGSALSVMMMDLDRFKYVNDTLGHHIGDLLLHEVGNRLRASLPSTSDTIARLGGDEFAVLLPTDDAQSAQLVATRLLEALEHPLMIEGQIVDVGASIGIVSYPNNGTDMNTLLRRADVAMYTAKRANLGFALYDERDDQHSAERLSLMSELRQAVERDELKLYYQPKVDLATRSVKYVESLVRWDHPTRGFISPDEFIPFAEQTGYIKVISRWVIDRAVRQCGLWRAMGLELDVSINVSARDLINSGLPETVDRILKKYDVSPRWIWIEITESAILDDPNHAIETLDRLHALGVRLSVDDFGTGYSSLSYLKRMPVDELKIDKSFVIGMADDEDDEIIVRSTIDLGHNMGLKVVAEGVESEAMLERLKVLRCDLAQGFHVSRPLPPEDLERWLAGWEEANGEGELETVG